MLSDLAIQSSFAIDIAALNINRLDERWRIWIQNKQKVIRSFKISKLSDTANFEKILELWGLGFEKNTVTADVVPAVVSILHRGSPQSAMAGGAAAPW